MTENLMGARTLFCFGQFNLLAYAQCTGSESRRTPRAYVRYPSTNDAARTACHVYHTNARHTQQ